MQKTTGSSKETRISQSIRVFISINLPPALEIVLQAQIKALRDMLPSGAVRWVNPGGIHLTLKFPGYVPVNQLDSVKAATRQAVQGCSPFELRVMEAGCFPNYKRPKVIWIGLKGAEASLQALRGSVENHIAPLGYPTETRPFHPHLTLGRVKTQNSREMMSIGQVIRETEIGEIGKLTCDAVHVMQSTLTPSGAQYQSLASYAF
ncbi:MAG TPA: RNA 2',3'-cyclic phosphodiesterase [Aggregatilineales bacterium]|nr:RNA 2',3'-cyclic phosphodiesterase [Aggregatilineales bacterium]